VRRGTHRAGLTSPYHPPPFMGWNAAARSLGVRVGLEALMVPLFIAAVSVPQATVLYWLTNAAFSACTQRVLEVPAVAAAVGLPLAAAQGRAGMQAEGASLAAAWVGG
jgi:hypothetical protein